LQDKVFSCSCPAIYRDGWAGAHFLRAIENMKIEQLGQFLCSEINQHTYFVNAKDNYDLSISFRFMSLLLNLTRSVTAQAEMA